LNGGIKLFPRQQEHAKRWEIQELREVSDGSGSLGNHQWGLSTKNSRKRKYRQAKSESSFTAQQVLFGLLFVLLRSTLDGLP
jgi:hypothetical protein